VTATPASDSPIAADVLVAQAVLDRLEALAATDPGQAASVAEAVQSVGRAKAVPIRIDLAGGPAGARYMALAPSDPDAPVVIYRQRIPEADDGAGWLVTSLVPRDEYQQYRQAERTGLLDDPIVRGVMLAGGVALALWLASRSVKPPMA
jgi:hypothetical protein